jgi:hypothetical protein
MVDFSSLLRKPAGEAKKPPALPAGDYRGIVKSYELGDNNKNKTPYVRIHVTLVSFPDDMDDDEIRGSVDLSKRAQRKDFYLSEDSMWRLDKFLRSCGLELSGRAYDEVLPELVNSEVVAVLKQRLNHETSEPMSFMDDVVGMNSVE